MLGPLLEVARDLSAGIAADERYKRLVAVARRMIPCDGIALLRVEAGVLVPVVVDGLRGEAIARRFAPSEHPRLARILAASGPVRFDDAELPDPFDGLFANRGDVLSRVHACIGCPLVVEATVIGVLTLDALDPAAFDHVDDATVALLAALAGAAIHTTMLSQLLDRAASREQLTARELVREALDRMGGELLGDSAVMVRLRHEIDMLAASELTTLITGETGVGKELVVHAIHAKSHRRDRTLVHVNCAALPEQLAESELFGHVRGSFTGAVDHRAGKFELADGGTLFLDEIGELPLSIQPKLLRVLQSGEVQRVGSDKALRVDVRVLAATNRDLAEEVRAGRFRSDLFYRLSVYPLRVPPLRDRLEDIPLLSGHFLDIAQERLGIGQLRVSVEVRRRLREHAWPGNVRELEHLLLRAALRASEGRPGDKVVIEATHVDLAASHAAAPPSPAEPRQPQPLREAVDSFTRRLIKSTVAECGNNWAEAARRLGVQRGNLHRLATRLGVRGRD
ncbi:MAG: nitric oxide reductase transcriptional regulator NorR [Myxococcales bacterium]|nr:nitric oxide reductase transcriptional regulator NorR [Myxococcales bacterium]